MSDDELGAEEPGAARQTRGRRRIPIAFIQDKNRRYVTFSKRKSGIMKKAYELSTLTGTQVLLLVASESGHVYTFATPKLQPLITQPEGKTLIQQCLNSQDPDLAEQDAPEPQPTHQPVHQNVAMHAPPTVALPAGVPQAMSSLALMPQASYSQQQQQQTAAPGHGQVKLMPANGLAPRYQQQHVGAIAAARSSPAPQVRAHAMTSPPQSQQPMHGSGAVAMRPTVSPQPQQQHHIHHQRQQQQSLSQQLQQPQHQHQQQQQSSMVSPGFSPTAGDSGAYSSYSAVNMAGQHQQQLQQLQQQQQQQQEQAHALASQVQMRPRTQGQDASSPAQHAGLFSLTATARQQQQQQHQ